MLSTREAGLLVGRSEGAVRKALGRGTLRGQRDREVWHVRAADVIAWAACSSLGPVTPCPHPVPKTPPTSSGSTSLPVLRR